MPPRVSAQCNYSDAEKTLADFQAKYPDLDVSTDIGDVTGQLLKCFCKMLTSSEGYMFSPELTTRSRARRAGSSGASSQNNPWRKIHSHDLASGEIYSPIVVLALCLGVDRSSSILTVYKSRPVTNITGRAESSRKAFGRL